MCCGRVGLGDPVSTVDVAPSALMFLQPPEQCSVLLIVARAVAESVWVTPILGEVKVCARALRGAITCMPRTLTAVAPASVRSRPGTRRTPRKLGCDDGRVVPQVLVSLAIHTHDVNVWRDHSGQIPTNTVH